MINHFILQNNGTEQEAKDVYQEAVIHFYEKVQSGSMVLSCQIKTYLYSVCRRLWLKKLAGKKRFVSNIQDFEQYAPLDKDVIEFEDQEQDFALMLDSLKELGEPCNALIKDFYWTDLSMEEIAEKFGYTNADNAKNQKYKCLQRLKRFFFSKYENKNVA